jgi:hypothetical protein
MSQDVGAFSPNLNFFVSEQPQPVVSEAPSPAGAIVPAAAFETPDMDVTRYNFGSTQSLLSPGFMGLRLPSSFGDVEAAWSMLELALTRLINENTSQRAVSTSTQKRDVLSTIRANYANTLSLQNDVETALVERDAKVTEKSQRTTELDALRIKEGELQARIEMLAANPGAGDEVEDVLLQLAEVESAITVAQGQIAALTDAIEALDSSIVEKQALIAGAAEYLRFLFLSLMKLSAQDKGDNTQNPRVAADAGRSARVRSLMDRELKWEEQQQDLSIQDFVAGRLLGDKKQQIVETSDLLAVVAHHVVYVLRREKRDHSLNAVALAHTNGADRLKLDL